VSIRLTVQADDPDVERLIDYLQTQYSLTDGDKIYLLERAIKWLKPATELYGVSLDHQGELVPTRGAVSVVRSDKHCQQQSAT
jgi:hypothetical protein